MKKLSNYIVSILISLLITKPVFSQTETFDIATYTAPSGWKKDAKDEVINYTHANASTGTFCVITVYASTASNGVAQTDFNNEWNEKVVTPYNAEANPKTETQTTAAGWKAVVGAAPVKVDGVDIYIILTVFSGFGKTMTIRTSLNDQSYTTQVDALLESMQLDKTSTAPINNDKVTTVSTTLRPGKFGAMLYSSPAGWTEQQFSDGVVFKPKGLPTDEHLAIQIMQPISFSGSMEQALQKSYDEAATMYNGSKMNYVGEGNYKKEEAKRSFQGWDYIRGSGGVKIGGGDYPPEFGLDLFVIKINNRFERIAILKSRKINRSCSMSAYYADDRQQIKTAIDNFLFSIQFTDGQKTFFPSGTTDGNGIIGVWQGISLQTTATSGIRYNVFSPIFLSNGQAYFGPKFPTDGLDGLDTRIPPELHRRDWGTYTFSNGRGVLKMPYANIPLRMEGNSLIITSNQTDHKFYQLPSVDGARFNGTYVMSEAYGKIPMITFTSNGGFNDNGAIKVLYHEYNECINPALLPGSGTYEVKDYTITFNYTDGRKIKIAFLGSEYDKSNPSPAVLRMSHNEDPLNRK